jgi:hypothetical protein
LTAALEDEGEDKARIKAELRELKAKLAALEKVRVARSEARQLVETAKVEAATAVVHDDVQLAIEGAKQDGSTETDQGGVH